METPHVESELRKFRACVLKSRGLLVLPLRFIPPDAILETKTILGPYAILDPVDGFNPDAILDSEAILYPNAVRIMVKKDRAEEMRFTDAMMNLVSQSILQTSIIRGAMRNLVTNQNAWRGRNR